MANCWITERKCWFGFQNILSAKLEVCKDCIQFLQNKKEIQVAIDDLEVEEPSLLSANDQENIWLNASVLRKALLKKITSLKQLSVIGWQRRQVIAEEVDDLLLLHQQFQKYG